MGFTVYNGLAQRQLIPDPQKQENLKNRSKLTGCKTVSITKGFQESVLIPKKTFFSIKKRHPLNRNAVRKQWIK